MKDECRALFQPAVRGLPCDWRGKPKHSPWSAEVGASWRGEAGRGGERQSQLQTVGSGGSEHTEEEGSDFIPLMLSVSAHQAWRCFATDEGKRLWRVSVMLLPLLLVQTGMFPGSSLYNSQQRGWETLL